MPNRDEFPHVFEQLKKILQSHVTPLVATTDTPDNYYLNKATPVTGKQSPSFFAAAVQLRKNYVSYHLMPVYMYPELLENISERLKKRMQGKSCFNFTTVDETLFAELAQLTAAGFRRFREQQGNKSNKEMAPLTVSTIIISGNTSNAGQDR